MNEKINGIIVRSNQWRKERIKFLTQKINDYQTRIKNAKAEIKDQEAELKEAK